MLVTLPEETPVNELVETAYSLEDEVGVQPGAGRGQRAATPTWPGLDARPGRGRGARPGSCSRAGEADALAGRGRVPPPPPWTCRPSRCARLADAAAAAPAAAALPVRRRPGPAEVDAAGRTLLAGIGELTDAVTGGRPVSPRRPGPHRRPTGRRRPSCASWSATGRSSSAPAPAAWARPPRPRSWPSRGPGSGGGPAWSPSTRPSGWPTPSAWRRCPTSPARSTATGARASCGRSCSTPSPPSTTWCTDYADQPRAGRGRSWPTASTATSPSALSGTQEYMAMEKLYELHDESRLRPRRGRHPADPQRPRLPRRPPAADPLPRQPPLPGC